MDDLKKSVDRIVKTLPFNIRKIGIHDLTDRDKTLTSYHPGGNGWAETSLPPRQTHYEIFGGFLHDCIIGRKPNDVDIIFYTKTGLYILLHFFYNMKKKNLRFRFLPPVLEITWNGIPHKIQLINGLGSYSGDLFNRTDMSHSKISLDIDAFNRGDRTLKFGTNTKTVIETKIEKVDDKVIQNRGYRFLKTAEKGYKFEKYVITGNKSDTEPIDIRDYPEFLAKLTYTDLEKNLVLDVLVEENKEKILKLLPLYLENSVYFGTNYEGCSCLTKNTDPRKYAWVRYNTPDIFAKELDFDNIAHRYSFNIEFEKKRFIELFKEEIRLNENGESVFHNLVF